MKSIFKYLLEVTDRQTVKLQGRILSVEVQHRKVVLYAVADDEIEPSPVEIFIVGTGHPADHIAGFNFLGTVQLDGGVLMFHIFTTP